MGGGRRGREGTAGGGRCPQQAGQVVPPVAHTHRRSKSTIRGSYSQKITENLKQNNGLTVRLEDLERSLGDTVGTRVPRPKK